MRGREGAKARDEGGSGGPNATESEYVSVAMKQAGRQRQSGMEKIEEERGSEGHDKKRRKRMKRRR